MRSSPRMSARLSVPAKSYALGKFHRWLALAGTLAGFFLCPVFRLTSFHLPASLRSTVITRFNATTDALSPAGRLFGRARHEHRLTPTGLPDYCKRTSHHSVSNHRRVVRGLPGCQRICARPDRLRLSLADSPTHADRIEFTAMTFHGHLCYGLVVLVPLLPTPHCCDAVTVRYRTILHRTGADFHCSLLLPSQAH